MSNVICVLTYKSIETILQVGGTQSWRLDRNRAAACEYVVICRNKKSPGAEGPEPHGMAFMVGKIKDVVPSTETEDRWLITISDYALTEVPDQWEGRNPVGYREGEDFDIDFKNLDYKPLVTSPLGLTIAEAKAGLSIGLNIPETAIEIIVRS